MKIRPYTLMPAAVLAFVLAGCAGLTESDCAGADWGQMGYRDGAAGNDPRRIEARRKSCAAYGIEVDTGTYRAGYEQGLASYCTPQNAVRAGLAGSHYGGVCPGQAGLMFDSYYRAGRVVHEQRRRVSVLEHERRQVKEAIGDADTEEARRGLRRQLQRLDRALFVEMDRLRQLELRLFY